MIADDVCVILKVGEHLHGPNQATACTVGWGRPRPSRSRPATHSSPARETGGWSRPSKTTRKAIPRRIASFRMLSPMRGSYALGNPAASEGST